jgi:hypothetical protein
MIMPTIRPSSESAAPKRSASVSLLRFFTHEWSRRSPDSVLNLYGTTHITVTWGFSMRQFSIAAAAAILLTVAPHLRAADDPYSAAGYAVTGFETLCGGDSTFGVVGGRISAGKLD